MTNANGKTATVTKAIENFKPQTTHRLVGDYMVRVSYDIKNGEAVEKRITIPFYGQITKKLTVHHDDGRREVILTIAGKASGKPYTVEVKADEYTDTKKLYLALFNHFQGLPPPIDQHLRKFIEPAITAITSEHEMSQIDAIPCTGWTPTGKAFVMPGNSVGRGNFICKLGEVEAELKHFGLTQPARPELEQAFMHLMSLKNIYRPGTVYTVIAHAFLPPLIRWVGNRIRYIYHIHGETGSGKTELAKIIMGLYGPQKEDAITYKWTDTPVGAESRAYALKDCLMLIDDFKPGTVTQNHRWVAFIQAAVDAMGRKRGTITGRGQAALPPRALLLSTGETVPDAGEESYTARMLQARLNYQETTGWNEQLGHIQDNAGILNGLMYEYINWLLKGNGQGVTEEYQALQNEAPNVKHARLRNNYVANRLGFTMFVDFCKHSQLMSNDEAEYYLEQHQTALLEITQETSQAAHSQRYSQRFAHALVQAMEVNAVYIADGPEDTHVQNYVGWKDDTFIYILAGGMKMIQRWARGNDAEININVGTLRRQLYYDGLTYSTPARIDKGYYDHQPIKGGKLVTALYREKLAELVA